MKKIMVAFLMFLNIGLIYSQKQNQAKCGTAGFMNNFYKANPLAVEKRVKINDLRKNPIENSYTIPVVFHVFGFYQAGKQVGVPNIERSIE